MKTKLKNIIYTIDSSEVTNWVLAIIQTGAGIAAFLWSNDKNVYVYFIVFLLLQSLVLVYFILLILISSKYKSIKLRLRRNTGILFDKTANITNVALRKRTINIMLKGLDDKARLYAIGKEVGGSFYDDFEEKLLVKGDKNYKLSEKIDKWRDYDSSSGMGRFEIRCDEGGYIDQINIFNPFTGDCGGKENDYNLCRFLHGYIESFLSRLYGGSRVEVTCKQRVKPQKRCECSIKITSLQQIT